MIESIRKEFNHKFNNSIYDNFLKDIENQVHRKLDFRICETPLFLDKFTTNNLINASNEILSQVKQVIKNKQDREFIPSKYFVPNEPAFPLFLQIDFAITKDINGNIIPKLIELQGFPSLYNFQAFLEQEIRKYFWIPEKFTPYFNNLDYDSYIKLLQKKIIGEHNPDNVILLDIDPKKQKTWIDFFLAEKQLGIKTLCISDIIQKGSKLYYKNGNTEILIERIYNRVIFDELENSNIKPNFNFFDDLQVEWLSHPNWFFKISKNILPLIKSNFSPKSYYLEELDEYSFNLDNYVLKPLFSFAGTGVKIEINENILKKIKEKEKFILQEKVEYAPIIKTPGGYAKTEIRLMYLWDDKPILVNNLLRVSKGKMIGVDYNKDKTWVGANIVFHI